MTLPRTTGTSAGGIGPSREAPIAVLPRPSAFGQRNPKTEREVSALSCPLSRPARPSSMRSAVLVLLGLIAAALAVDVYTVDVVGGIGGALPVPGDPPGYQFIQYCSGTSAWNCNNVRARAPPWIRVLIEGCYFRSPASAPPTAARRRPTVPSASAPLSRRARLSISTPSPYRSAGAIPCPPTSPASRALASSPASASDVRFPSVLGGLQYPPC